MIAVQGTVDVEDVPVATAITMFFNQAGASIFLTVSQAVFLNKLLPQLQSINSNISKQDIITAGATGLKQLVTDAQLPDVLVAYARSLDGVFHVAAAITAVGAVTALGVEWKRLKHSGNSGN